MILLFLIEQAVNTAQLTPPNNFWAILIPSLAAIITALNLKGIIAEWNARKEIKVNEIKASLQKSEQLTQELRIKCRTEREARKRAEIQLRDHEAQLNNMKLRLSIALPLLENANLNDDNTLELIQIIKDGLKMNTFPADK